MSNNDLSMNVTLQDKLVIGFVKLFKNAVVKKIDDGNYLDVHMPDDHISKMFKKSLRSIGAL